MALAHDLSTATEASVAEATEDAILAAEALVARAVASTGTTFAERIQPLDRAMERIQDAHGYGPLLANFHPDEAVRNAGNASQQALATWATDLISRTEVFEAVSAVDIDRLEGLERRSADEWLRDLRRAGHGLPPADRERVRVLQERLITLQVEFAKNIADHEDHLDVPLADLDGLPDAYVSSLGAGDAPGTVRVTLDYPAYVPFMEQSPHRDQRRELQYRYLTRAVQDNRPLLEEALALRTEVAQLLGYENWAAYSMDVKMADPASVEALYDSVVPGITRLAVEEKRRLEELLREDVPGADLEPWDRQYYHTLQQKRDFGIDQNEVAEYFSLDTVVAGMLEVTGEVFGLSYTELPDHPTWHDDVRTFRIDDADTGAPVAHFHLDLHPRAGKFTHAACWNVVDRRREDDGSVRTPVAAVAANFTKPAGDTPSLLKHDEAVTLWHEFGHVLHACLTEIDVQRFAGFDTEWDFVEAPSQIMENWMWNSDVLKRFAVHHGTGDPIPDAMVQALVDARDQNIGLLTLRQVFLGKYDLAMHTAGPRPDLDALEREANEFTLTPLHEGTFMAASFGHLMGGYDAGYYGYLWSKVYGDDMFSVFEDEGVLSPEVGRRYRAEILAMGSARDAWDHLEAFLGRPPNADAFLAKLGIA